MATECELGAILGPFESNPFPGRPLALSTLNTAPKATPGEHHVFLDLPSPSEAGVNAGID